MKTKTKQDILKAVKGLTSRVVSNYLTDYTKSKEELGFNYDFFEMSTVYDNMERGKVTINETILYLFLVTNHVYNRNKDLDYSFESCLFYHYFGIFDVTRFVKYGIDAIDNKGFKKEFEEFYKTVLRIHDNDYSLSVSKWNITPDEAFVIVNDILDKKKKYDLEEREINNFYALMQKSCEGINPKAHLLFADKLYGDGVDPDFKFQRSYKKALTEYLKAGDFGDYKGYMNAGYIYYYNRLNDPSVENYEEAFKLFSIGRNHSDLEANYKISDFYFNGYFVNKNINEAYYIVENSVEQALAQAIKDDLFYLGPYCLREARILELRDNPINDDIILADYLVCDFCYKDRMKHRDFFGDLQVLNNNKEFLANAIKRTKLETIEMSYPYVFKGNEFKQFLYKAPYYLNNTKNKVSVSYHFSDNKVYLNITFVRSPIFVFLRGQTVTRAHDIKFVLSIEEEVKDTGKIYMDGNSLISIDLFSNDCDTVNLDGKIYHIKEVSITSLE